MGAIGLIGGHVVKFGGAFAEVGLGLPMINIGHSLPAYASSQDPSYLATKAVDPTDYYNSYHALLSPVTWQLDISTVVGGIYVGGSGYKGAVIAFSTDDATFQPDLQSLSNANIPGSYTIQVNSAAGGGAAPSSGWTTVVTVTGNLVARRAHIINLAGQNWIQISVTIEADSSTSGPHFHVELWNGNGSIDPTHTFLNSGWMMLGDSIYSNGQMWGPPGGTSDDEIGNDVHAVTGYWPLRFCCGFPGWTTTNLLPYVSGYVANFPGKFVQIGLGTNDAVTVTPSTFSSNLRSMATTIQSAGKICILDTVPWCLDARVANIPALNAVIAALIAADPTILPGSDRWVYMSNNMSQISGDNVHPNSAGFTGLRALQTATMVSIAAGA